MSSTESKRERLLALREKLSRVPQRPGVYIHKDDKAKVLYVGKAKNLQSRLRSYFTGLERQGPKTQALVAKINDFEVILVDNENESLVLENNLIKHHKPPYNFLLRDDKTYPYLKINLKDPWPKLIKTRQRKNDGALYFGPFTTGSGLDALMALIHKHFPLIKCTPNVFRTVTRPCNYYEIKRCLGPCKLPVDRALYMGVVDDVISILQGRTNDVLRSLKKEMKTVAEALNFERAAQLRDQISAIENLQRQQSVALEPGFDADIVGCFWHTESASFYVSTIRDGKLVGGTGFVLRRPLDEIFEDDVESEHEIAYRREAVEAFLCQYYQSHDAPPRVYVPCASTILQQGERDRIAHFLRLTTREEQPIELFWEEKLRERPRDKVKKSLKDAIETLFALTTENARNRLQEELRVDEAGVNLMQGLKDFLNLPQMPLRIECYDISTFQGAQTVAAGVVFKNGRPAKSDYRRYIIRDTTGQDDFASLREVMRRRFKQDTYVDPPDCLVIDGGEPQVREVGHALKSLGLDTICYFGLAKSRTKREFASSEVLSSEERVVLPQREDGHADPSEPPITKILKRGSPEFRLLTQVRDEAHRFAISFHRKRRERAGFKSVLNSVEGLGPKRRKKLFTVYPNFTEMRAASADEIATRVGIPLAVAEKLKSILSERREN